MSASPCAAMVREARDPQELKVDELHAQLIGILMSRDGAFGAGYVCRLMADTGISLKDLSRHRAEPYLEEA